VITIRATGEISDDNPALMAGRCDICLMTYEKFGAMVLASPHLLNQVGTIVVDEVQMLADPNRGANLEFILTLLKSRRSEGVAPQVICLSAVIGDTGGLERWLDGRQLRHETRPVPLVEGVLNGAGRYHFRAEGGAEKAEPWVTPEWSGKFTSQDLVIPLVRRLIGEGKQIIVFREIKGETVGCAGYLAARLGLPAAQEALDGLPRETPRRHLSACDAPSAAGWPSTTPISTGPNGRSSKRSSESRIPSCASWWQPPPWPWG
jgi:helicase